ncbi:MAG TPA: DNA polymerase II small subunit, partial [Candidatus Methanomethylia archaeon]|nr:DNA polymerase II small subunit [Candidatus Methanomethylicia archaeon]
SMHRELASKVKYLVIAGDLVDGIGVYPGQEDELALKDVYKQYEYAARLLSEIPDYIQIIIIPGNHDAAFPAIPSPPIFKEYAEPVYELPNVLMLGDPSHISLHEVEFLITHGRSLDDAIPSFPGCSFSHPEDAMVELLKCRHLAPIYGQKTPLAPVPRDYLVVERIPDVFQAGHVHMMGAKVYKGILVVNTGTWQSQTSYQRSMGLEPKPAIATLVNLVSLQPVFMEF